MNLVEPTQENIDSWGKWCEERPAQIAALAKKFPPWKIYRLKPTGHKVTIYSFEENEDSPTLKVDITQALNPETPLICERRVFGVKPEDLEET